MSVEASLLIAILSLLGNAFFVAAEFALVSARRTNIELRAADGSTAAKICLKAMDNIAISLATIQFGVTLCSLLFGAIAEPVVAHLLVPLLDLLSIPEQLLHPISLIIAITLMVSLHVVIGEMVPKNLSLADPTASALRLIPSLFRFVQIVKPIVIVLNGIANGTLRLLGLKPRQEIRSSFSRDEVAGFVEESQREGLLSKDEGHRLAGSLSFEYRTIEKIIIPLAKTVIAPQTVTPAGIRELSAETDYSRFPISGSGKRLIGYVHLKDMLTVAREAQTQPVHADQIRTLGTVAPSTTLMEALTEMRKIESHILQVQQGDKTVGLIMLEDVLEELVGPISDVR